MEYRRNEIRAGVFLLLSFAILAVMVFAVSDIQSLFKKRKEVKAVFLYSDGIEKNAQVRLSGIKIGKVVDIRVAPERGEKVELMLSIFSDTMLKQDTKAAIKSLGLVGGKYVELTGGSPEAKPLEPGAVITGDESLKMEDLTKAALDVVSKLKNIATNVDRLLGDPALTKSIKTTVQNLQQVSSNISEVTADVKVMTASKDEVAQTLKNLPELLKKVDASVATLKEITDKTDKLMGENREKVDATLENVKEITANIKEMTDDVKKHPWKLIRKP
jgi:phospholipid/cholesterol/gamma-HCH transport system substrate-binding protein